MDSFGFARFGLVVGIRCAYHIKNVEKDTVSLIHNVDYFISDESFSEVHNAKALLAGLSRRFLTELRSRAWLETQNNRTKQAILHKCFPLPLVLISALEHWIEEFRGTEHEIDVGSRSFACL